MEVKKTLMEVLNDKQKNIFIESPFNKIFYNFALQNIFSLNWELRHSSALVIRSFIRQNGFNVIGKLILLKDLTPILVMN